MTRVRTRFKKRKEAEKLEAESKPRKMHNDRFVCVNKRVVVPLRRTECTKPKLLWG